MSVNLGGLLGPAITGWVWGMAGFHWGFGIAAVGMALGLIQYTIMRKTTIKDAGHEIPNPADSKQRMMGLGAIVVAVLVMVIGLGTGIIKVEWLSNIVTAVALIAAVYFWQKAGSRSEPPAPLSAAA